MGLLRNSDVKLTSNQTCKNRYSQTRSSCDRSHNSNSKTKNEMVVFCKMLINKIPVLILRNNDVTVDFQLSTFVRILKRLSDIKIPQLNTLCQCDLSFVQYILSFT